MIASLGKKSEAVFWVHILYNNSLNQANSSPPIVGAEKFVEDWKLVSIHLTYFCASKFEFDAQIH